MVQEALCVMLEIDPAISSHSLFGRAKSLSGGSGGSDLGGGLGGRERRSGAEVGSGGVVAGDFESLNSDSID